MFHTFIETCPLLSTSMKKLGRITNINICSHNPKFSEKKTPFYTSILLNCLTGCPRETYDSFLHTTCIKNQDTYSSYQ